MANRVSTYRTQVLLAGGSTYATAIHLQAFLVVHGSARVTTTRIGVMANDKTNGIRVTTASIGVHANDKTNGVLATTLRVTAWASLDQGLYMGGPFGGGEVFTPSFTGVSQFAAPEPPVVEVNPWQAEIPNTDQQRILREQHNFVQAGDSTFHWGVLVDIYGEAKYTLGSLGRFYHDDYGIIQARFCKFVDFAFTDAKAVPVGWAAAKREPWVVTNRFDKSSADLATGIVLTYNENLYKSGEWYGWVIVDGIVPAGMEVQLDSTQVMFGTEYAWTATGKVKPAAAGNSLGTRFTVSNVPTLLVGQFKVQLRELSLSRLQGIITVRLAPLVTQLDKAAADITVLTATVATHTQQIAQQRADHNALAQRLTTEVQSMSNALAAIRSLMPDTNFKQYVDVAIENMKGYVDANNTVIEGVANAALLRANEAYALAFSSSPTALQTQIDALNQSMGDLTERLVGFTTVIDTNTLDLGMVLVTVDGGLTPGGEQLYLFEPVDFAIARLIDVDGTMTPNNGDVLTWNNSAAKYEPQPSASGSSLASLSDVTIPSPTDNQVLTYKTGSGKWEAASFAGAGLAFVQPTILQRATMIGDSQTVTFGSAFTAGTLLVAFQMHWNNVIVQQTQGWVQVNNTNGVTTDGIAIAIKRPAAAESTTQQPFTGSTGGNCICIFEISDGLIDLSLWRAYQELVSANGSLELGVPMDNSLIVGMFGSVSANAAPTGYSGGITNLTQVTGTATNASPRQIVPFSKNAAHGITTAGVTYASGTTRQYGLAMVINPRIQ